MCSPVNITRKSAAAIMAATTTIWRLNNGCALPLI